MADDNHDINQLKAEEQALLDETWWEWDDEIETHDSIFVDSLKEAEANIMTITDEDIVQTQRTQRSQHRPYRELNGRYLIFVVLIFVLFAIFFSHLSPIPLVIFLIVGTLWYRNNFRLGNISHIGFIFFIWLPFAMMSSSFTSAVILGVIAWGISRIMHQR